MKSASTTAQMKDVTPGSILGGRRCTAADRNAVPGTAVVAGGTSRVPQTPSTGPLRGHALRAGPKKFAEPVSLSSTASADLPLPGTALGLGFDLLALRARRKQHTNVCVKRVKGPEKGVAAICGNFIF